MPARIVIVHDDAPFARQLVEKFPRDAMVFQNPVTALTMLAHVRTIEFLICRLQFADRQPVGLSLARLARQRRPEVRVVFTGDPDHRHLVHGLGEFVPEPVAPAHVAMILEWLA
jgi:ActR/RegA family two-component response regulator